MLHCWLQCAAADPSRGGPQRHCRHTRVHLEALPFFPPIFLSLHRSGHYGACCATACKGLHCDPTPWRAWYSVRLLRKRSRFLSPNGTADGTGGSGLRANACTVAAVAVQPIRPAVAESVVVMTRRFTACDAQPIEELWVVRSAVACLQGTRSGEKKMSALLMLTMSTTSTNRHRCSRRQTVHSAGGGANSIQTNTHSAYSAAHTVEQSAVRPWRRTATAALTCQSKSNSAHGIRTAAFSLRLHQLK